MTTNIKFISHDISRAIRGGSIKKYPNLSYGDGFALACALETNSIIKFDLFRKMKFGRK